MVVVVVNACHRIGESNAVRAYPLRSTRRLALVDRSAVSGSSRNKCSPELVAEIRVTYCECYSVRLFGSRAASERVSAFKATLIVLHSHSQPASPSASGLPSEPSLRTHLRLRQVNSSAAHSSLTQWADFVLCRAAREPLTRFSQRGRSSKLT